MLLDRSMFATSFDVSHYYSNHLANTAYTWHEFGEQRSLLNNSASTKKHKKLCLQLLLRVCANDLYRLHYLSCRTRFPARRTFNFKWMLTCLPVCSCAIHMLRNYLNLLLFLFFHLSCSFQVVNSPSLTPIRWASRDWLF